MSNKKYNKMSHFVLECIISIITFFLTVIFVFWTKFKFPLLNIFFIISIAYDVKFFALLFNIIRDAKKNNIVTETLYVSFILKKKFEFLCLKKYTDITCNKVKDKKYTNEIIYLKSIKDINLKEKSFVKISYYKNSKIIYSIDT